MKRLFLAILGAVGICVYVQSHGAAPRATTATSTASTPDSRAIEAVRSINPQAKVERVTASPMRGFREAVVGGQVVYVSDDGRYLFLPGAGGALFDITTKTNLSESAMAAVRKQLIGTIAVGDRIVFAPPHPKYTVTVFTDVECGYCRRMHSQIAQYNQQGIAIHYLAFPRMGPGSEDYKKMVSVWCAPDRRKALTDAKNDRTATLRTCKTSVDRQYGIGQRVGLNGTPMIVTAQGVQVGGYLSPTALRAALDKLNAAEPVRPPISQSR